MRNKQRNERNVTSCPSREEQETTDVTTVVMSDSSCSVETAGRHGTNCVAAPPVKRVRAQQHTKIVCVDDNETSPAAGNLGPTAGTARFVISEQGPPACSPFTHGNRCCRRQLIASALHGCLEEIQRSNPLFPVYEVFSCLQKKVNLQDSGDSKQQYYEPLFCVQIFHLT